MIRSMAFSPSESSLMVFLFHAWRRYMYRTKCIIYYGVKSSDSLRNYLAELLPTLFLTHIATHPNINQIQHTQ